MSKDKKSNVEQNNINVKANNNDQDDEINESPFWFWFWIGVLVLMFIGFALFNKYCVEDNSSTKAPAANIESAEPTTEQPSVTK